jgi:hypothetical protein
VTVAFGASTGCDVRPPQRLDVSGVPSAGECDDMGGVYVRAARTCRGVDY